ncbi:hypothetical protein NQ317_009107 [Molorchus minor]|uniref:Uncharacterized protein n=1 Tax=Molorchus minor TaxID=1323400 RepID=A0ABQ9IWU2_9CUCU|nr:hypothetical protein NQ317_009107 [Molorchus minor]
MDEAGLQLNNKPGFVTAEKGLNNVAAVTSSEKSYCRRHSAKSATVKNAVSTFQATGIVPFRAIPDYAFPSDEPNEQIAILNGPATNGPVAVAMI